MLLA
ncbi:hypothetical protein VCHENC02_1076A, partial [Vibrio harveyi]|jgi:hypothetical protein